MSGKLILIPTPIDEHSLLHAAAQDILLKNCLDQNFILLVEEHKESRRRWLRWGLPREAIERFVLYNEHTRSELQAEILSELKQGKTVFLMSDCGLPGFCDPGQNLIRECHLQNIVVTSTPFFNSIALAVALSGIKHDRFVFEGFVPAKAQEREVELKRIANSEMVSILMDTPYRMMKLMEELKALCPTRECFIGLDLNKQTEQLLYGSVHSVFTKLPAEKREFIFILGEKI